MCTAVNISVELTTCRTSLGALWTEIVTARQEKELPKIRLDMLRGNLATTEVSLRTSYFLFFFYSTVI